MKGIYLFKVSKDNQSSLKILKLLQRHFLQNHHIARDTP